MTATQQHPTLPISTGIPQLDDQHADLLHQAMELQHAWSMTGFDAFVATVERHMADEEAIGTRCGLSMYAHAHEHASSLVVLRGLRDQPTERVAQAVVSWLMTHLCRTDMAMSLALKRVVSHR